MICLRKTTPTPPKNDGVVSISLDSVGRLDHCWKNPAPPTSGWDRGETETTYYSRHDRRLWYYRKLVVGDAARFRVGLKLLVWRARPHRAFRNVFLLNLHPKAARRLTTRPRFRPSPNTARATVFCTRQPSMKQAVYVYCFCICEMSYTNVSMLHLNKSSKTKPTHKSE